MIASLIGVFVMTIYVKRNDILNIYYISTMLAIFVVELALILVLQIPIPHSFSIVVLPFAIMDFLAVLSILSFVKKIFGIPDKVG